MVTAEPEVRQVTLPVGGGRLVLASDGLWDAVNPKTALHHVRASPASKAANELVPSLSFLFCTLQSLLVQFADGMQWVGAENASNSWAQ